MTEMLTNIDGVRLLETQGAFYAFPDFSAFYGRDIAGKRAQNTLELAAIILEEAKVAIVPGEAFGSVYRVLSNPRPQWRGRLHRIAGPLTIIAGVFLAGSH